MIGPTAFPAPPADGLSIGPLDLRAYGLMIALGVIVAVWLLGRRLTAAGAGTSDDASSIGIWGVVGGLVGARLYHVATEWDRFADDLGRIPQIWKGGLGIPGGLALGIAAGVWRSRRLGLSTPAVLTAAAPAIPLAQAIGRWGNWFNQELYGRATDLPWALSVDPAHLPAGVEAGTTFHPTFLYESLWNLALAAALIWVDRTRPLSGGRLMALYVAGYGVGRFWVEGLRIDPADSLAGLRWNQWVALAAVIGAVVVLVVTRGAARRVADAGDPVDDDR
jgi:prolipoprotein diacylglyceryl transferase